MPIISYFPLGGGSGGVSIPLENVTSIETIAGSGEAFIRWTDPDDVVIDGQTVATWRGTKLMRKAGSYPKSPTDGTSVIEISTHNYYRENYFQDKGLANNQTYYYKLFPYNHNYTYTNTEAGEFTVTPAPIYLDGVSNLEAFPGFEKVTLKWVNPADKVAEESSDVTIAKVDHVVIVYSTDKYPEAIDDGVAYTTKSAVETEYVAEGLTNGTTYYFSLFPVSVAGDVTIDESSRVSAVPQKITIEGEPSQSGTLTYTGSVLSPVWSNYNSTYLTIGGVTSATDAGTYEVTFTPTEDAMWEDGTSTAKTISWTINKADCNLFIEPASLTLNADATSGTITAKRNGNGTVSVSSSDTNVVSVSVSGNTITVSSVNEATGMATITVSVEATTNYEAASETCEVTASFLPANTGFANMSWEDISKICKAGKAASYWEIGDIKTITYTTTSGSVEHTVEIIGFDHDDVAEEELEAYGRSKAGITCLVTNCVATGRMHGSLTSSSATVGWSGSSMRTSTLADIYESSIPSDLKDVIIPVSKLTKIAKMVTTNITGNKDDPTTDTLFLLSETEVFGSETKSYGVEGAQYSYFGTANNRKKTYNSTNCAWWLRSPEGYSTTKFCYVGTGGAISTIASNSTMVALVYHLGIAFAFCV